MNHDGRMDLPLMVRVGLPDRGSLMGRGCQTPPYAQGPSVLYRIDLFPRHGFGTIGFFDRKDGPEGSSLGGFAFHCDPRGFEQPLRPEYLGAVAKRNRPSAVPRAGVAVGPAVRCDVSGRLTPVGALGRCCGHRWRDRGGRGGLRDPRRRGVLGRRTLQALPKGHHHTKHPTPDGEEDAHPGQDEEGLQVTLKCRDRTARSELSSRRSSEEKTNQDE